MTVTFGVMLGLTALVSFLLGVWVCGLGWKKDWMENQGLHEARKNLLIENAAEERRMYQKRLDDANAFAAAERRELYSRIQAYDPNVGDFRPPDYTAPPSRPGEEQQTPRSFTEEELGQMGLVQQADGMIRDTRSDALFETVEDWRFWQEDLKKRSLPLNLHPQAVQEMGWEGAVTFAKQEAAKKKAAPKNGAQKEVARES